MIRNQARRFMRCGAVNSSLNIYGMEWKLSKELIEYEEALSFMEARVADIHVGKAGDLVWLLEHPPLYTAGTSAKGTDLLDPQFPVYKTGRGGEYTYHGPGQRVAYVIKDLKNWQKTPDIKRYIWFLEEWVIRALAHFGVTGERREGRIGIWVDTPEGEKKIAAIGVRVRHWIAFHGVAVNVDPDLEHFSGIVPCGIREYGVTSLQELINSRAKLVDFDLALKQEWLKIFEF